MSSDTVCLCGRVAEEFFDMLGVTAEKIPLCIVATAQEDGRITFNSTDNGVDIELKREVAFAFDCGTINPRKPGKNGDCTLVGTNVQQPVREFSVSPDKLERAREFISRRARFQGPP